MPMLTLDRVAIATGLQVFTNQLKRGNIEMIASEPLGDPQNARLAVRHDDGTIGVYRTCEVTSYPSRIVHADTLNLLLGN